MAAGAIAGEAAGGGGLGAALVEADSLNEEGEEEKEPGTNAFALPLKVKGLAFALSLLFPLVGFWGVGVVVSDGVECAKGEDFAEGPSAERPRGDNPGGGGVPCPTAA